MSELILISQFLNLLVIPVLVYIVKIEKRITKIETYCSMHMKGKILIDESEIK